MDNERLDKAPRLRRYLTSSLNAPPNAPPWTRAKQCASFESFPSSESSPSFESFPSGSAAHSTAAHDPRESRHCASLHITERSDRLRASPLRRPHRTADDGPGRGWPSRGAATRDSATRRLGQPWPWTGRRPRHEERRRGRADRSWDALLPPSQPRESTDTAFWIPSQPHPPPVSPCKRGR